LTMERTFPSSETYLVALTVYTTSGASRGAAQLVTPSKLSQSITFTSSPPGSATVGGPTYNVTATGGGSGNPVTFSIDAASTGICSISGSTVSFNAVGSCAVDANQAGGGSYGAALPAQQTFAVAKGSQTIAFTSGAPGSPTVGG